MPQQQFKKRSPFPLRRTGCFLKPAIILPAILVLAAVFAPVANAQSLSDKLLQDMAQGTGADLRKLTPRNDKTSDKARDTTPPALRPENKIPQRAPLNPQNSTQSADFDFYVLSLSWSPSYCADNGNRSNASQQCGLSRNYGFVAHGLWPQYNRGFPESCDHAQANDLVPRDLVSALSDIMPSAGLMRHEWRKHGTCAGLSQRDYFSTLHNAYQAVIIPPAFRNVTSQRMVDPQLVEKAFIAANPGLPANAIAVTCKRRRLEEVRICMDTGLKFRQCAEVDRNSCRSRSVSLLPNR